MSRKFCRSAVSSVMAALLLAGTAGNSFAAVRKKTGKAPAAKPAASPATDAKTAAKAGKAGTTATQPMVDENARFTTLVDGYFDEYCKFNPTFGTEVGLHQYDGISEDYSADSIQRETAMEHSYLSKVHSVDPTKLNRLNKLDRQVLLAHIENQIFNLEVSQNWKKNPDLYSGGVTNSVFSLIKRDYAPLEQRMQYVISRAERIPAVLAEAKKNLVPDKVPRVFADINLEQMQGTIDFFQLSLPDTFKTVSDSTLRQSFAKANLDAIDALKDYQRFVTDMVAKNECKGSFALGPENYAKKLRCEQMIDTPLDKLLTEGYDELHSQQKQFKELSLKLSPGLSPEAYFQSISKDHPKADGVLKAVTSVLDEIRAYCVDKNIVTIPGTEQATVAETPPFERALSFASMDTPGPYEPKAREAFYYVTLPEPDWSAKRTEEHLRSYSYPDIINTSVHEAYPGHYVQFLWSKQWPSKTRKLIDVSSNSEGWAHYCEQMMLDEGLKKGDDKLRLVQIHDALLRCCRYIVAIEMHTKGMTLDQAIEFFIKEGYMERANAEREAKRGTSDPTYLVYTYGKMKILAMRDEYQKAKGAGYTLKDFHDKFLKCGAVPLKIVRAELFNEPVSEWVGDSAMSDDSPVTN